MFGINRIALSKVEQILKLMYSVMRHRSSNDSGSNVDTEIGYNHQQLSIIDLECGHKPMYNEDGYLQIVCRGDATIWDCAMIWNRK